MDLVRGFTPATHVAIFINPYRAYLSTGILTSYPTVWNCILSSRMPGAVPLLLQSNIARH